MKRMVGLIDYEDLHPFPFGDVDYCSMGDLSTLSKAQPVGEKPPGDIIPIRTLPFSREALMNKWDLGDPLSQAVIFCLEFLAWKAWFIETSNLKTCFLLLSLQVRFRREAGPWGCQFLRLPGLPPLRWQRPQYWLSSLHGSKFGTKV